MMLRLAFWRADLLRLRSKLAQLLGRHAEAQRLATLALQETNRVAIRIYEHRSKGT